MQLLRRFYQYFRSIYLDHLGKFVFSQLDQIYFCEYRLKAVFLMNFFYRYGQFVGFGFCWEASVLAMLAFRNIPSARIVRGLAGPHSTPHSWLEFRYLGIWWVIDPCWYAPFIISRRAFYADNQPDVKTIITYREFWSCSVFHIIYDKLRHAETSHLFFEIYALGVPTQQSRYGLDYDVINRFDDMENHGELELCFPPESGILFSQRIFDQYMHKATRTLPKRRAIRQARLIQKLTIQAMREALADP